MVASMEEPVAKRQCSDQHAADVAVLAVVEESAGAHPSAKEPRRQEPVKADLPPRPAATGGSCGVRPEDAS